MPIPGHRPIHSRFSKHHRPVASGTHTSTVIITRLVAGPGTLGPEGYEPPPASEVYRGPARITPSPTTERNLVVGEAQVVTRRYALAITWDAAELHVDDLVRVTDGDDPELVGKTLRIADVEYGSVQWERVATAVEDQTRPSGG